MLYNASEPRKKHSSDLGGAIWSQRDLAFLAVAFCDVYVFGWLQLERLSIVEDATGKLKEFKMN